MTWLRLDDDWYQRPAIVALSSDAFRLHVAGMSHTMRHLTDRVVSAQVVSMLAPGYRPRVLDELLAARLWLPFPDGSGWWVADPVMDEQPTAAEVIADREGLAARQDLSRARNPKRNGRPVEPDPEAIRRAEERAEAARKAKSAAVEEKRRVGGRPPWTVTPSVTRDTTGDSTRDDTRESQRPDPTRPGDPTGLSGSEDGDPRAASSPVLSFRERGILPPPLPAGHGSRRKAADEETLDDCRRILNDPTSPPWLVADAEDKLGGMGLTPASLLAAGNGR